MSFAQNFAQSYVSDSVVANTDYIALMEELDIKILQAQQQNQHLEDVNRKITENNDIHAYILSTTTNLNNQVATLNNKLTYATNDIIAMDSLINNTVWSNDTNSYVDTYTALKETYARKSLTSKFIIICDFDYQINDSTAYTFNAQLRLNADPNVEVSHVVKLTTAHISQKNHATIMYKSTGAVLAISTLDVALTWRREVAVIGGNSMTISGVRYTVYEISN